MAHSTVEGMQMQLHGANTEHCLDSPTFLRKMVLLRRFIGSFYSLGFFIIFLSLGNYPASFVVFLMAISAPFSYGYAKLFNKPPSFSEKIPGVLAFFFTLSVVATVYLASEQSFIYIIAYPTALAMYSSSNHKYRWAVLTAGILAISFIVQTTMNTYVFLVFLTTCLLVFSFAHLFSERIKVDHNTLARLALQDSLTSLQNRRALEQITENPKELESIKSFIFLDIDEFKEINDKYGHIFGDEVIKAIANVISNSIDNADNAYRYGGEEFIIVSKGETNCQDKSLKIKSNIEKIRMLKDIHSGNEAITFTASIGIAQKEDNKHMNQLIKDADSAMYHAKEMGRNRVVLFGKEMLTISAHPKG